MTDGISEQERRALFARVATGGTSTRRTSVKSSATVTNPSRPRRRFGWTDHLHKIAIIISFLLISNKLALSIIGVFTRRLFPVRTVFLVYPGADDILQRYSYGALPRWALWRPTLIGAYNQGNSWGLVFAIACREGDSGQADGSNCLKTLHARMESIRRMVGASEVRFAGVLSGRLYAEGLATSGSEENAAVNAVLNAEPIVRRWEGIDAAAPIIVLGADTFAGQLLMSKLTARDIHAVNVGSSGLSVSNHGTWPARFLGKRTLLINVARTETLTSYLDLVRSALVILNEAYPAPSLQTLQKIVSCDCRYYHVAGAVGDAYPSFPWPYGGAIPCCAAHITDQTAVVVRRLA